MGVHGLWDIVASAGRRISPSILSGRKLVVDASIWLIQFTQAIRNSNGAVVRNAHIVGFFWRLCRLLYHRILPIVVFDGPAPPLKRKTLYLRRIQREKQTLNLKQAAQNLLINAYKQRLLQSVRQINKTLQNENENSDKSVDLNNTSISLPSTSDINFPSILSLDKETEHSTDIVLVDEDKLFSESEDELSTNRRRNYYENIPDAFRGFLSERRRLDDINIPQDILRMPLASSSKFGTKGGKRDEQGESSVGTTMPNAFRSEIDLKMYQIERPDGVHDFIELPLDSEIDPETFKTLPPKFQYQILTQLRDAWFNESRMKALQAEHDLDVFSHVQIESYLRTVRTNKEISIVKKTMADELLQKERELSNQQQQDNQQIYISGPIDVDKDNPSTGPLFYGGALSKLSNNFNNRNTTSSSSSNLFDNTFPKKYGKRGKKWVNESEFAPFSSDSMPHVNPYELIQNAIHTYDNIIDPNIKTQTHTNTHIHTHHQPLFENLTEEELVKLSDQDIFGEQMLTTHKEEHTVTTSSSTQFLPFHTHLHTRLDTNTNLIPSTPVPTLLNANTNATPPTHLHTCFNKNTNITPPNNLQNDFLPPVKLEGDEDDFENCEIDESLPLPLEMSSPLIPIYTPTKAYTYSPKSNHIHSPNQINMDKPTHNKPPKLNLKFNLSSRKSASESSKHIHSKSTSNNKQNNTHDSTTYITHTTQDNVDTPFQNLHNNSPYLSTFDNYQPLYKTNISSDAHTPIEIDFTPEKYILSDTHTPSHTLTPSQDFNTSHVHTPHSQAHSPFKDSSQKSTSSFNYTEASLDTFQIPPNPSSEPTSNTESPLHPYRSIEQNTDSLSLNSNKSFSVNTQKSKFPTSIINEDNFLGQIDVPTSSPVIPTIQNDEFNDHDILFDLERLDGTKLLENASIFDQQFTTTEFEQGEKAFTLNHIHNPQDNNIPSEALSQSSVSYKDNESQALPPSESEIWNEIDRYYQFEQEKMMVNKHPKGSNSKYLESFDLGVCSTELSSNKIVDIEEKETKEEIISSNFSEGMYRPNSDLDNIGNKTIEGIYVEEEEYIFENKDKEEENVEKEGKGDVRALLEGVHTDHTNYENIPPSSPPSLLNIPNNFDNTNIQMEDTWDEIEAQLEEEKHFLKGQFNKLQQNQQQLTEDMQEDVRELLQAFGIPYVEAPAEAEAQCAFMTRIGLCDGVISEDSDCLAFGSLQVFRNFFESTKTVEMYDLNEIERALGLTHTDIVLLSLLLGCDYTTGVHGVGAVNAIETLRAFPTLQQLEQFRIWALSPWLNVDEQNDTPLQKLYKEAHKNYRLNWQFPDDFPSEEVIDAFFNPHVDKSNEKFSWSTPNYTKIHQIITNKTSISHEQVDEALKSVHTRLKDTTAGKKQKRIEEMFEFVNKTAEKAAEIKSKRMLKAMHTLQHNNKHDKDTVNPSSSKRRKLQKTSKNDQKTSKNDQKTSKTNQKRSKNNQKNTKNVHKNDNFDDQNTAIHDLLNIDFHDI